MKSRIRAFSLHREAIGNDEIEVDVGGPIDIGGLLELLDGRYPELKRLKGMTIASINHRYADPKAKLKDGDEVAFFPPVGGG